MQLGILSDTHDRLLRTHAAVRLLVESGAEVLIHCGDITIPEVVYELAPLPSYFVFGNCDFEQEELRRCDRTIGGTCLERGGLIELGGHRMAVTHGDSSQELDCSKPGSPITCSPDTPTVPRRPPGVDPVHQPRCPAPRRRPGPWPCSTVASDDWTR